MDKESWGLSTSIDMTGDAELIRSEEAIRTFTQELVELIDMKTYGPCHVVKFGDDPAVTGYSMFQLIEASNISAHFADATNRLYLDVFSCKSYDPMVVLEFTKKFFKGSDAKISWVNRK